MVGIELVRFGHHPAHDALGAVTAEDPFSEVGAVEVLGCHGVLQGAPGGARTHDAQKWCPVQGSNLPSSI